MSAPKKRTAAERHAYTQGYEAGARDILKYWRNGRSPESAADWLTDAVALARQTAEAIAEMPWAGDDGSLHRSDCPGLLRGDGCVGCFQETGA